MMKPGNNFEVPAEMREMLEKGVDQARQGFESVMKVAAESVATIEEKADVAAAQANDMRKKSVSFAEASVSAAFDFAARLVKAKNIDEVVKLQNEYVTSQFNAVRSQAEDAGKFLQEQTKAVAEDFTAEAKKMQAKAKDAVEQGVAVAKEAASQATKAATRKR